MVEKYDSLAANTTASLHAAAAALFVSWQEHRRPYNNCGSNAVAARWRHTARRRRMRGGGSLSALNIMTSS